MMCFSNEENDSYENKQTLRDEIKDHTDRFITNGGMIQIITIEMMRKINEKRELNHEYPEFTQRVGAKQQ